MGTQRVWRIAVAGNTAALLLLTLLFAHGPLFFVARAAVSPTVVTSPVCASPPQFPPVQASRIVVIVVDALRLDSATDRQLMPTVTALVRQGGSGVAVVETLIPSTVAAIQALISGVIVLPLAFIEDFTASPAEHGGVLAAIQGCAGRTFVAGPRLWTDLYGQWITKAVTTEGFAEDDERLLTTTITALDQWTYQFMLVHFSRPDHAAHQHGAYSDEYRRAVRWCDEAIARLLRHTDASTAVVITADHGVTRGGGHAGLEPAVQWTPLIIQGPGMPAGGLPSLPQAEIPLLLRSAFQPAPLTATPFPQVSSPWSSHLVSLVGVLLAVRSAQRILGGLRLDPERMPPDAILNATIWVTLLLSYSGIWQAALALGVTVLVVIAYRVPLVREPGLSYALGVGCLFGGIRFIDGAIMSGYESPGVVMERTVSWSALVCVGVPVLLVGSRVTSLARLAGLLRARNGKRWARHWPWWAGVGLLLYSVGGGGLALAGLLTMCMGILLGRCLRLPRASSPVYLGMIAALIPAAGARLVGETVSLSTIDVQVAFTVVDSVVGLPGAVLVALLRQALLSLSFAVSVGWRLRTLPSADLGRFAAGLATTWIAQALPATGVLFLENRMSPAFVSLALGTVLHLVNEVIFCFLALAGVVFTRSFIAREGHTHVLSRLRDDGRGDG